MSLESIKEESEGECEGEDEVDDEEREVEKSLRDDGTGGGLGADQDEMLPQDQVVSNEEELEAGDQYPSQDEASRPPPSPRPAAKFLSDFTKWSSQSPDCGGEEVNDDDIMIDDYIPAAVSPDATPPPIERPMITTEEKEKAKEKEKLEKWWRDSMEVDEKLDWAERCLVHTGDAIRGLGAGGEAMMDAWRRCEKDLIKVFKSFGEVS